MSAAGVGSGLLVSVPLPEFGGTGAGSKVYDRSLWEMVYGRLL